MSAEALLMPVRRAAPFPWLRSCRCRRIRCSAAAAFVKTSNVPSVEQSSTTTTSATHGCARTNCRTASTVACSLKAVMMPETFGVAGKDALIGSQSKFAALQKRRKTVPDECDELVTILSLALWGQLPIHMGSARDFLFQAEQIKNQQPFHEKNKI